MAKEDVIKLFRQAQQDPNLRQMLNQAATPETFVEIAQSLGYSFTVDEWREMTGFNVEEFQCEISEIPGI